MQLLGNDSLIKLSMLADDSNLMSLFNKFVLECNDVKLAWQEAEFWEVYKNINANEFE
jgi:hypothetical protein